MIKNKVSSQQKRRVYSILIYMIKNKVSSQQKRRIQLAHNGIVVGRGRCAVVN